MTDRLGRKCDRTTKLCAIFITVLAFWSTPMLWPAADRCLRPVGAFVVESNDYVLDHSGFSAAGLSSNYPSSFDEIFRIRRDKSAAIRVSAVVRPLQLSQRRHFTNGSTNRVISTIDKSTAATSAPVSLCLGIEEIFIALILVLLILTTVLGNILVMFSVFLYKRMRTFNNFLLTSLATADLLVGLLIMPLSLVDLLYNHRWPFGRLLCSIWATTDVLLCTASILNLCIISLDRYMAITSPLKYPRTRSRLMAAGLLCFVWGVAMIVCSPPWFIPEWGLFFNHDEENRSGFICAYSPSVPYRIYSALVSFYIPLIIMLFVYFKIFRVASEREKLMRQNLGTCRLSRRVEKTQRRYKLYSNHCNNSVCTVELQRKKSAVTSNNYHTRCASEPMSHIREVRSTQQLYFPHPTEVGCENTTPLKATCAGGKTHSHNWNSVADFAQCVSRPDQSDIAEVIALSLGNGSQSCSELHTIPSDQCRNNNGKAPSNTGGCGSMRKSLSSNDCDVTDKNSRRPHFTIIIEENTDSRRPDSLHTSNTYYDTAANDQRLPSNNHIQLTPNSVSSYSDLIDEATFPDCVELASSLNNNYAHAVGTSGQSSTFGSQRRTEITNIFQNKQHSATEKINCQFLNDKNAIGHLSSPKDESTFGSPLSTDSSAGCGAKLAMEKNRRRNSVNRPLMNSDTQIACRNPVAKSATITKDLTAFSPNHSKNRWSKPKVHQRISNHLQPVNLLAKAQQHYNTNGPGKNVRGSKEKIVYLRERKALKTIGIVVLGFIICWMPFFVLYILQVVITGSISDSHVLKLVYEFFLWLGYSNSVLNPIIYTMYNGDFRRCFRDLLGFGCVQQHRRTMSVKKLHQQSTVF